MAFRSHRVELLALTEDPILDGFSKLDGGLFKLGLTLGLPVGEESNQRVDSIAVIEVEVHSLKQPRDLAQNSVVIGADLEFGEVPRDDGQMESREKKSKV
jgi:hypothetical protein